MWSDMANLKKFNITMHEEREAMFTIEAESREEAERLVAERIRNDDYFCDDIEERYENGVVNEEIHAYKADDDATVDYDYKEMIGEEEEN